MRMNFLILLCKPHKENDFMSLLASQLLSARILNQKSFLYILFGLFVSVARKFSRKVFMNLMARE